MPLRIGHRGAAGTHPENTMAAFRRAVELGCDGVEFDVHRTSDGQIIVMHDFFLGRTANGEGLIMATTLEQLKQLDAGSWKAPEFAGERIPTLVELIRKTPASLMLFMEMKAGSVHYPGIEEDVVRIIREEGALERFQISSFDHKCLRRIHELAPEIPLGMLYSGNPIDPVGMAKACGASALHPSADFVKPEVVAEAHAAGLQVNVWTCNPPWLIEAMKLCGVDGIMSDYPDRI